MENLEKETTKQKLREIYKHFQINLCANKEIIIPGNIKSMINYKLGVPIEHLNKNMKNLDELINLVLKYQKYPSQSEIDVDDEIIEIFDYQL